MKALENKILSDGKYLGNGILKVDSFVNHQVDPALMMACGEEFARQFKPLNATRIITVEISGIAPALTTGIALGIPIVYARKSKPITMPDIVLMSTAPSHTKGRIVEIMASPEYLQRVIIVDDFLASGQTILALTRIIKAAGAQLVGIGALIEKTFEGGRAALEPLGVPIVSLARIVSMDEGHITFAESASAS